MTRLGVLTRRCLAPWGKVAIVAAIAVGSSASTATPQGTRICGQLGQWRLPRGLIVTDVSPDSSAGAVMDTKAGLNLISLALEFYCEKRGGYPPSFQDLADFAAQWEGKTACIFAWDDAVDAWQSPVFYGTLRGKVLVVSAGSDHLFSTPDDIIAARPTQTVTTRPIDVKGECGG